MGNARGLLVVAALSASCVGRASPPEPQPPEDAVKTPQDNEGEVVDGPAVSPPSALLTWLEGEGRGEVVQLPVTVSVSPLGMGPAWIGVEPEPGPDALHLRLDDGALGIALADRLRQACPAGGPCAVWLEGRWGSHLAGPAAPSGPGPSGGPGLAPPSGAAPLGGPPPLSGMVPGSQKHPFAVSRFVGLVEGQPSRIRRVQ